MKISTRIIIGFVISAACIIGLAVFAHSNIDGINSSRAWVAHTVQVLIEKETLESDLKDLESRIRGYVASGDERFLDGTENLKKNIDRGFVSLMALTADNPRQQQNLKELSPLLSQRLQQLERLKSARSEGGIAAARNFLHLPENNDTWRWVNAMNKIKSEEEHLLKVRTDATIDSIKQTETLVVLFALGSMLIVGVSGSVIVTGLSRSIAALIQGTDRVAAGELNFRIPITTKDELAVLARAFNAMIDRLRTLSEMQVTTDWHRSGLNKFSVILQGQRKLDSAGQIFLEELVPMLAAHYGALYAVTDEDDGAGLKLVSIYGGDRSAALPEFIEIGHGLVGQCARDQKRIILHDIPADRFTIKSGLVETKPFEVLIVPLIFEGRTRGVLELASLTEFTPAHLDFLEELSGWIASVLNAISVSAQVEHLLNESQMMNEELQAQQEELECQQDELRSTNEELEEKAEALDIQNQEVLDKNIELEQMQSNLEAKASELAMASKYKSEFLANMSHDLRTPLNSLLIFSELLAENDEKNLQDFQIDYAKNIHSAGKTLLSLIDDVLDLSKIESGTVVLDMVDVQLADIVSEMQRHFEKAAQNSGLEFEIKVADDVPKTILSDSKRLSQLLTNLLSNAFKFTPQGSVKLHVAMTEDKQDVSFQVIDTGIGIAKEKQELVFEAFRQADNTIKASTVGPVWG
jgi:signal transduction histidine kinase/CHASE3 domain sensor protein